MGCLESVALCVKAFFQTKKQNLLGAVEVFRHHMVARHGSEGRLGPDSHKRPEEEPPAVLRLSMGL